MAMSSTDLRSEAGTKVPRGTRKGEIMNKEESQQEIAPGDPPQPQCGHHRGSQRPRRWCTGNRHCLGESTFLRLDGFTELHLRLHLPDCNRRGDRPERLGLLDVGQPSEDILLYSPLSAALVTTSTRRSRELPRLSAHDCTFSFSTSWPSLTPDLPHARRLGDGRLDQADSVRGHQAATGAPGSCVPPPPPPRPARAPGGSAPRPACSSTAGPWGRSFDWLNGLMESRQDGAEGGA